MATLPDQILLNSNPSLISICLRWPKSNNLLSTFCTYVYSNNKYGFFCSIHPKEGNWRCDAHKNCFSTDFEINVVEKPQIPKIFTTFNGFLVELNTLQVKKPDGGLAHLHVVDNQLYLQDSCIEL
jgi:hypothetical protein